MTDKTKGREALEQNRRERWDPRQRYRLYVVPAGGRPADRIEIAACETEEGIGGMAILMRAEGEVGPNDRTAILDTAPWEEGAAGTFILGSLA